jgi:Na+/H+-dicarboxylate symporter
LTAHILSGMLAPMKIWLKYLIAAVVGTAAGLVIPAGDGVALDALAAIALNVGRYMLFPLMFFSVAVASFELHEDRKLARVWGRTILYSVVTVMAFALLGLAGAFLFSPGRIPLTSDASIHVEALPGFLGILGAVIPGDAFAALASAGFLLPITLLATIMGLGFAFDRTATKPVVSFFDSMSRICWQINSFFVEILPLPLILAAAARAATLTRTQRLGTFGPLFLAIGVEAVFAIFAVLPLALYLIDKKRNPYKTLFALTAPAIAALVSGHGYVQAGATIKHLKESLGIRRRSSAVSLPLALAFGRAGSAMVTATAFVAVLNSYSNLGLGSGAILWMIAVVPITALALGAVPGTGPIVALAALCVAYGRGFESGYVLVAPAALPMALVAAAVDTIVSACIVSAVADTDGLAEPKDLRHFI